MADLQAALADPTTDTETLEALTTALNKVGDDAKVAREAMQQSASNSVTTTQAGSTATTGPVAAAIKALQDVQSQADQGKATTADIQKAIDNLNQVNQIVTAAQTALGNQGVVGNETATGGAASHLTDLLADPNATLADIEAAISALMQNVSTNSTERDAAQKAADAAVSDAAAKGVSQNKAVAT
ncbi:hypothetical protein [Secundilactobacillus odoratitofui]|uniref:hypothetical protein n=1 Tax=Secundilactobacillus odoratitofui TaxID=480930 RepID=UPI0006D2CB42|nr:hypothetical protein [Secundilactobacillus odoratitofui]